jgi:hypothetical protein
MRWNYVLIVIVLAALCFGGSFTCEGHSGGSHFSTTQ